MTMSHVFALSVISLQQEYNYCFVNSSTDVLHRINPQQQRGWGFSGGSCHLEFFALRGISTGISTYVLDGSVVCA